MSSINQKADIQHYEIEIPGSKLEENSNTKSTQQSAVQAHAGKLNPAPVGFGAFALCSFVLGMYNTGLITNLPQVAVGVAFGYGAMGQFVCGICELIIGNIFAATSMLTFSGFFLTYGIMMIPSSGFFEFAIANGGLETVHKCMGLVQIAYAIIALIFFLGSLRQPILIRLVLLQVFLAFFTGGIGGLAQISNFNIASGWISFCLSLTAWYVMAALLFTPENTMIKLPFF